MHYILCCLAAGAVLAGPLFPPFETASASGSSLQAKGQFRARLSVVPIDVAMQSTIAGSGMVTATLSGAKLTLSGNFADLKTPATVARLHAAPRGIRGPAVLDLTITQGTSGTISGTFELTPAQVDDLLKSRMYVQLHSAKAPDGNLWGWLLPLEGRK